MLKHLQSSESWETKSLGAKGFTLIELLVVIIILGILAGVAIFAVNGIDSNAKDKACLNEKDTIQTAVEAFKARTGNSPTSDTDLTGANGNLSKPGSYWTVNSSGNVVAKSGAPATC